MDAAPLGREDQTEATAPSFRAPILRGLAWKTASRVVFEVTKLVVAVLLARMLTPTEYGLAGMVLVLVAFEPVLSGVALASALVQRRELSEEDRSTVFWTNVAIGATCSAIGVALSGPAASFYGDPSVQPLFAATSLCFFLSSLGITHAHLLVREMRFRALELRAMAGIVVGATLALVAAASGYGPWALVVQQLGVFATSTVLLWVWCDWHPRLLYSRRSFREVRAFGGHVSGTLLLFQLNQNTDNVLIGRYLGASALGTYALAYNIILVPFSRLASPLHEVLYPVFSRLQDDRERLVAMWLKVVRLIGAVAIPVMLSLIVIAPDAVRVVFGTRWADAVPVVQILAWVGTLFVLQGLNSVVLQAVGRTRLLLLYALASFIGGLAAFVVGLRWGIVGVAACFAVVSTVMQPLYMDLTARTVGASLGRCLRELAGVVQVALLVVAAVAVARQALLAVDAPAAVRLAGAVAAGAAVYLPACAARAPDVLAEARKVLRAGRRGRVPAVPAVEARP